MSEETKKPKRDRRKQSLYLPVWLLDEISEEARLLDQSISRIMQDAWRVARVAPTQLHPPGVLLFHQRSPHSVDSDPITEEIKNGRSK